MQDPLSVNLFESGYYLLLQMMGDACVCLSPPYGMGRFHGESDATTGRIIYSDEIRNDIALQRAQTLGVGIQEKLRLESDCMTTTFKRCFDLSKKPMPFSPDAPPA